MGSPVDTVRKMLLAHQADDGGAFRAAVEELIAEERRKNHHVVARELERLLQGGGEVRRLRPFRTMYAWENDVPKDGDRGLPLLQVFEPARSLDELILRPEVRQELDRFAHEVSRGELLRAHGIAPPSRLLLCGPPGCGKTSAAEAVARALLLPLAVVRFDVVVSSYLGETAANLRKIFDFIVTRPMVVLFDEFDAIAKQRDDDFEHGELKRVVNAFLQLLDGLRGDNVVIAATNHQGLLDSAVWRRFDEVVHLGLPSPGERKEVLLAGLRGTPIAGLPDWSSLMDRTEGMAHADLERIALMAVREAILNEATMVPAAGLDAAVARYQTRMAVVASAAPKSGVTSGPEGTQADAVQQGLPPASAPGDADRGASQPGAEEEAGSGHAQGARARAKRPVRSRHRAPSGPAADRDEAEGSGSGG